MKHIRNLPDLEPFKDDPELWRELYGLLSALSAEIIEYGDPDDLQDHDFNLLLLDGGDQDYLIGLGQPEEAVETIIQSQGVQRVFRRMIYPAEIIFQEVE